MKSVIKAFLPYGLVEWRRSRMHRAAQTAAEAQRADFHTKRRETIARATTINEAFRLGVNATDRAQVSAFLEKRGIAASHIQEGSIPAASLAFMREHLVARLPVDTPLIGLHVGNFVGVSLAFLSATLKHIHPDSIVIGVDPNLIHRGIDNPQKHVAALLTACGLQHNTMLVAGYSDTKSISNDGVAWNGYSPADQFATEAGCERVIGNLDRLLAPRCHVAMVDGNHEAAYLRRELAELRPLMQSGGILVLDDVDTYWEELKEVFDQVETLGFRPIGTDNRVGLAQAI